MNVAIVTGAARGIGAAIADRLERDHEVLRVDIDPSVDGVVADVTKPEDRARILDAVGGSRSACWSTTRGSRVTRGS